MAQAPSYQCSRCGSEFQIDAMHTEIVRRDFVEVPQPSRIERLCRDCWKAYIDDFLEKDFDMALQAYETAE